MEAAWNRGDFRGYMEGFPNPDVLIEGERIVAVGTTGTLPVPPDPKPISTEGMTVLSGP